MRADSTRTLRVSFISSPDVWLITCIWSLSGAKHVYSAWLADRWIKVDTACAGAPVSPGDRFEGPKRGKPAPL